MAEIIEMHPYKIRCQSYHNFLSPRSLCTIFLGTSGGDVRITTIDNVKYEFNGHGEYVFLKVDNE